MDRINLVSIRTMILIGALVLLLGFLNCGGGEDKEVSMDKEKFFTMYFQADLSRAIGFANAPRAIAMADTIDFLNQKFGGLADATGEKRKFRLEWYDDQYDFSLALPNLERWGQRKNFIYLAACALPSMVRERMAELECVMRNCSGGETLFYPPGWIIGTIAFRASEMAGGVKWIVDTWDFKKMGRSPRIAFCSYDTAGGRTAIKKSVQNYAEKLGAEVVDVAFTPLTVVDPATWLARFKSKKADWVVGLAVATAIAPLVKENHIGNYGLKFLSEESAFERQGIMKIAGGPEACDGKWFACMSTYYITSLAKEKPDSPAAELYRFMKERRGDAVDNQEMGYTVGATDVLFIYELIKEIFAKRPDVTWENLHSRDLMTFLLENWENKNHWDMMYTSVGPTRRNAKRMRIVGSKNGYVVPVTEWFDEPVDMVTPKLKEVAFSMPTTPPLPKKVY
ncbi:MAG: ABC transporter substrate-binding protein [Desulfatiglans sp.]|nr:ABC transporter substrate-binding protein [Thermodesulfobacteriota bacterium]MEE4353928.1 ABC transporter substrate-binding protein [Desulfatiglans sp.]